MTDALLSSEPETIHLPPVTLKLAKIQYLAFEWPVYVFRHLPLLNKRLSKDTESTRHEPIVPQLQRIVQRGGEDVLAIWREFDEAKN